MLLLFLSFVWTVATALKLNGFNPTSIGNDFTISRLPQMRAKGAGATKHSELKVTGHTLSLTRKDAMSLSSLYVQAMRGRGGISRVTNGTTPLASVEGGQVYTAEVLVGGQKFSMVIDTGSSDPWLAVTGFQCFDPINDAALPVERCEFGPLYDSSTPTFESVPNMNFNISYADGEYLNGGIGFETFRMAGIEVPRQQFGVIDIAAWYGDGISSGLMGFAYRTLTSAYPGSEAAGDSGRRPVLYSPLFVSMVEQQAVPNIFSMAISRDLSSGGIMALGGIPDIPHSPYFASTPIVPIGVNATSRENVYTFYTIDIDGFAYTNDSRTRFNPYDNANTLKTPLVGNGTDIIVDSGTSLCYVPDDVADGLAASFSPPATWDAGNNAYFVDCDATAPVFGVGIDKKIFYVNPKDLIIDITGEGEGVWCVMGIQPNLGGLSILGGTWMKNVLAVFDLEAKEMRFAAREFYGL